MLDLLNALGGLIWTLIVASFNFYKELIGIRNNVLAVALGVSPFVAGLLFLAFGRLKQKLN